MRTYYHVYCYTIFMYLIGLTGAIGHGKSTIAEIMSDLEPNSITLETSGIISEVATLLCSHFNECDPKISDIQSVNTWISHIPHILYDVLGISVDSDLFKLNNPDSLRNSVEFKKLWEFIVWAQNNRNEIGEAISPTNKSDYRPLLQWIGGFCVENISPTIWNSELLKRARKAGETGRSLVIIGGIRFNEEAVNIQSNGGVIIEVIRPAIVTQDSEDPTERQRSLINPDFEIMNNGTLDQLREKVVQLYTQIS